MLKFLLLSLAFLSLFGVAEWLYRRCHFKAEHTRKTVHVGTGLLTLLFPLLLESHWEVMFLCASFAAILWLSQHYGHLPSINAIPRKSHGSLCYPLAVWASFFAYERMAQSGAPTAAVPPVYFFYLPVLTMALCDPVAALVGRRWPLAKFKMGAGTKSLGGSLAFWAAAVALSLSFFCAVPGNHISLGQALAISTALGTLACLAEALTPYGLDNLSIPLACIATLWAMGHIL